MVSIQKQSSFPITFARCSLTLPLIRWGESEQDMELEESYETIVRLVAGAEGGKKRT
jgi:hypothetical protein